MAPPRCQKKCIQAMCLDSVLIFSLMVLMGHLAINYWERYTIQSELITMKNSVHNLKNTIYGIGKAYDNLQGNLNDLVKMVDPKQVKKTEAPCQRCKQVDNKSIQCKNKDCPINKKGSRDVKNIQAVFTAQADRSGGFAHKGTEIRSYESKKVGPMLKNVTTITRNPLKSIAISSEFPKNNIAQFIDR